ncbi:hypothetical protein AVEN_134701-1 [Araneus ventricosus]|uniref:Uncharacterized protein n=1 Tax=Araneus ventricosus TaxID=182803 RepID=A0A4Y2HW61_ARAVE|nr:hypothetical protein AVEN_134701-1 [Araneus ventricosus]
MSKELPPCPPEWFYAEDDLNNSSRYHRKTVISLLFWMKMCRSVDRFLDEEVNVLTAKILTFPLRELPFFYEKTSPQSTRMVFGADDESSRY